MYGENNENDKWRKHKVTAQVVFILLNIFLGFVIWIQILEVCPKHSLLAF